MKNSKDRPVRRKPSRSGGISQRANSAPPVAEEPGYAKALRQGHFVDPLSEVTRKERKNLLLLSFVSLAVTLGNLVPQEISALGIKVSAAEQRNLFVLLAFGVVYLVAAFIFYGQYDFRRWQLELQAVQRLRRRKAAEIQRSLTKDRAEEDALKKDIPTGPTRIDRLTEAAQAADDLKQSDHFIRAARRRLWFEYSVPLLAGTCALLLLAEGIAGIAILSGPTSFLRRYPILASATIAVLAIGTTIVVVRRSLKMKWLEFKRWRQKREHKRFVALSEKVKALPEGSDEKARLQAKLKLDLETRMQRLLK